jgi:nitroreductase
MELIDAIYKRRAVRSYTDGLVDRETIHTLLRAAAQAPSAINTQPWAFAVIQDRSLLKHYSDRAKSHFLHDIAAAIPAELWDVVTDPSFNMFYNAGTLILICAKSGDQAAAEDCCLAAQNLMLAACDLGLGTCPIGFARSWLNLPEVKAELGIPAGYAPITPFILGYPAESPPAVARLEPEILFWK